MHWNCHDFAGIEREIGSLQLEVLEYTLRTFCTSWQHLLCTLLILKLSAGFCKIHLYIVSFGLEKNVYIVQLACNHKSMHFVITSGVDTCRKRNLLQRSRRPQKLEMRCVFLQLEFVLDLSQYISCGHGWLWDCQPHALLHFPICGCCWVLHGSMGIIMPSWLHDWLMNRKWLSNCNCWQIQAGFFPMWTLLYNAAHFLSVLWVDQVATKILAQQLIRLRQQIAKLQGSRAQIRGVATHTQVRGVTGWSS